MVIDAIRKAVLWSQSGAAAGVVTDPIQKSCLNEAGYGFPGHTEYLSSLATTMPGGPLMMLACDKLRVVPATVHIPLKEVSNSISTDLIIKKCTLMRIIVCKRILAFSTRALRFVEATARW